MEKKLRNAKIIDSDAVDIDAVGLGSKVRIKDLESGDELDYVIVGSMEADPANSKISNESPVGKAIMGQKIGSVVDVNVPVGTLQYQIVEIFK